MNQNAYDSLTRQLVYKILFCICVQGVRRFTYDFGILDLRLTISELYQVWLIVHSSSMCICDAYKKFIVLQECMTCKRDPGAGYKKTGIHV